MISNLISIIFGFIYLVILTVVLLSWIPIFDTRKEPFVSLINIYNVIMAPFKAVIPPIGMFDVSPIAAFFVLSIIQGILLTILGRFGL